MKEGEDSKTDYGTSSVQRWRRGGTVRVDAFVLGSGGGCAKPIYLRSHLPLASRKRRGDEPADEPDRLYMR